MKNSITKEPRCIKDYAQLRERISCLRVIPKANPLGDVVANKKDKMWLKDGEFNISVRLIATRCCTFLEKFPYPRII